MMRWIVGQSLHYKFVVLFVAAAMMFFGAGQLQRMPVDVFPEFAPPRVEIQTACWGLSATEVEALVTIPLEQALQGMDDLDIMRSKSVQDLSSIELIFDRGKDLMEARQEVQERLATITFTLPTWAAPPIIMQPLSATSRTMKIGLTSEKLSVIDMSMITYWKIRPRLLEVKGVANIAIWGEKLQMQVVQVDPERLRANGISLDQVMLSTADAVDAGILRFSSQAVIGTGGFIDTPNQRLSVRHVLPIVAPEDLAQVSIDRLDGRTPLRIGDVATVVEDHQPLFGDAVINGGPGLMLVVEKFPWANTLEVTRGVEEALDQLGPGLPDIAIDTTIFRPATFIEISIDNLTTALLIGCLLVILVLGAFLFEWRTALISATAIPLSLMAAGVVLELRGTTINVMILAGLVIAVGVVVDDAIIDVENIWRRLRQNRLEGSTKSVPSIILEASVEVRSAIVYATMIDVVALLPVLFMEGLSGAFFKPMAISYGLAVMASLFVALTVTPALALILLRNAPLQHRSPPLVNLLQKGYAALLVRILRRPAAAYGVVAVIALAGVGIWPQLGQSLLPEFKERDFLMHWVLKPGSSHPEMVRITQQACKDLLQIPGVRNCGSHIGQALMADEVYGIDFTENWVSVDPSVDYDETVANIQNLVTSYPGLYRDVQTYLKERIREVLAGTSHPILIRVYGQDMDILRAKADELKDLLAGVEGIKNPHVELIRDVPQAQVEVNLEAARRYGVIPGDVRRSAATLVAGEEVGDIFRAGKAYDVVVWSTPESRRSVTDIENLLIDTAIPGQKVRLADVASVTIRPIPNAIRRQGSARRLDVDADVEGRDLGSVVADVRERLRQVEFPHAYHAELLGEHAERQKAAAKLQLYGIAAAIGVFLLLQASYGSFRLASLSFFTLPSALVGALIATYLTSGIISLGALVGFFTVLGIAARNGIMMINHYQHLERYEGEKFGPELILRGARERLSPILMTALATGLALVPLAIAGDKPGHEIEHPMAIVILGGLVTSTLLNLFIVPVLYLHLGGEGRLFFHKSRSVQAEQG